MWYNEIKIKYKYEEKGVKVEEIVREISEFLMGFGYVGIFVMMMIESSFVPFPSEVALLPAGYMIGVGKMKFISVILAGTLGSLMGAYINYYIGKSLGRNLLIKYGKYLFLTEERLKKMENLFQRRGELIVFFGRFIPVIRQYISFPPGIVKMNILKFSVFTSLGASVYVAFIVYAGKIYEKYQHLINIYILEYKYLLIFLIFTYILYKIYKFRKKTN